MKRKGNYSSASYPSPDGHSTRHRPRRNYWGNLYEDDCYNEDRHNYNAESYTALYDAEDDHDSYYDTDGYE